ncbi:MAG: tetratricopeptide repeat protein [Treponemataceae bacterium]
MFLIVIVSLAGIGIPIFTFLIIRALISPLKYTKIENLLEEKRIFDAIKQAKKILFVDAQDYQARLLLAKLYLAEQKDELALIELKFIMQIQDKKKLSWSKSFYIEYHKILALVYMKLEKYNDALDEFLMLIKLEPKNAEYFFQVGKLLEKKGLYDQAALYYQQTGKIDKRHAKSFEAMGLLLLRFKKFDQARQAFETILTIDPEDMSIHYCLGQILKEEKKYPQALEAFNNALLSEELKQKAHIEKGFCFLEIDKIENAMVEFEYAVEASKKQNSKETLFSQYLLGFCYEKLEKFDHALSQWTNIYEKDKNFQNVAQKIEEYQIIKYNKKVKDFISLSNEYFIQYCLDILQEKLVFYPKKFEITPYGCKIIATHMQNAVDNNTEEKICFLFSRQDAPLSDDILRYQFSLFSLDGTSRMVVYSLSGYTQEAISFKQSKPIDLKNSTDFRFLLENLDIAV